MALTTWCSGVLTWDLCHQGWESDSVLEMQYRLAMSLVGQWEVVQNEMRGLSKYVECRRLLEHVARRIRIEGLNSWWASEANELHGAAEGLQVCL